MEMGGQAGGDGWLSWWRWVAKFVAHLLATAGQLSGFGSRHLPEIQNGRHKQRSGQRTLARQKNIQKSLLFLICSCCAYQ